MLLRVHCSAQSIIQGEITDKVAQKEIRKYIQASGRNERLRYEIVLAN
jgi:hypothetical protein